MGDIIDQAQEWNELYQRVSFLNQSIKSQPETDPDFDGRHCVECGDEVEAPRLALKRVRCIGCQDLKERDEAASRRNGKSE